MFEKLLYVIILIQDILITNNDKYYIFVEIIRETKVKLHYFNRTCWKICGRVLFSHQT
jgi:hypothetical protein